MDIFESKGFGYLQNEKVAKFSLRSKYLVVEDDLNAQPLWENFIRRVDRDAVIRWACTEEGAEDLIDERFKMNDAFDIVIVDIHLAGKKSGIDLWRRYCDTEIQFLFTSGITAAKFRLLIGKEFSESAFYVKKPLGLIDCVNSLNALKACQRYRFR